MTDPARFATDQAAAASPAGPDAAGGPGVAGAERPDTTAAGDGAAGHGGASWDSLVALQDVLISGVLSVGEERPEEGLRFLALCESRQSAAKATLLAGLARRDGAGKAADVLRDQLKQSRGRAKRDVKFAGQLANLRKTGAALNRGDITSEAARLIVEAAEKAPPEAPADEGELLAAARREPGDVFRHTVREHLIARERQCDDPEGRRKRQRAERRFGFSRQADGMYNISGRADPVTGARIEAQLMAMYEKLRHSEDATNRPTGAQRLFDALDALLLAARDGDNKAPDATLVLIADYDAVSRQVRDPRLWDDTPLTWEEFVRYAADAKIVPSLWKDRTTPLWFGRRRRHANWAQRLALQIRDKHCVGCKQSVHGCEPHHIVHWEHGGKTDIDNLCLLCRSCHKHHLHRQGAEITQDQNGRYHLAKPGTDAGNGDRRRRTHERQTRERRTGEPLPAAEQTAGRNHDDLNEPLLC